MPSPNGSEVVNVLLSLPVTAAQTAAADIYDMGWLPEDCVLVDAIYAATDIDTGTPAHAMSFGFLNSGATDLDGTALQTAITVGQAGTAARLTPTLTTLAAKSTSTAPRKIGYKVTTASATGAAGTVHLSVSYRSTAFGA
jgi:hypothetical protein